MATGKLLAFVKASIAIMKFFFFSILSLIVVIFAGTVWVCTSPLIM